MTSAYSLLEKELLNIEFILNQFSNLILYCLSGKTSFVVLILLRMQIGLLRG